MATPDDLVVKLSLDRTSHEFYPSVRELVLIYDAVKERRTIDQAVGTGDLITVTYPGNEMVRVDIPPITTHVRASEFISELESVLSNVFQKKDEMSDPSAREDGLEAIQMWLEDQGGALSVHSLYNDVGYK